MNVSDQPPDTPQSARPAHAINRRQRLLFVLLTIVLSTVVVIAGRVLLRNSEALTFAVSDANGLEARFASKLATMLRNNGSRLKIRIAVNPDNGKAIAQFDRREADLVLLRTDAKIPGRARALAVIEHDVLLLLSPANKKIASLAVLRKKKVALLGGDGESSLPFIRDMLDMTEASDAASRVQQAPPDATLDKLFAPEKSGGYGAVLVIAHASKVVKDKGYEQFAKRSGGFTVNAIDEAKALARKNPGISEETLETGMLSSSPQIPDDDLTTVGLQWVLVAQSRLSQSTAEELARLIYENKSELVLADGFGSKIEPADTDKDAFIVAHPGAAGYINDDTKTFMDRYSDVMYLGVGALSIIGSICAGIYAKFTRIAPEKASELASRILEIGERVELASNADELEALQDELEDSLRIVVMGLRDGTIKSDGLDTFKLGYEFVRDQIAMHRERLKRYHDPNMVVVKSVHGG